MGRFAEDTAVPVERSKAWRSLALVVKAKLEAVEAGVSTFEDEFLAHTLLPDGQTVGQFMHPQVATAYETGRMPSMLPMLTDDAGAALRALVDVLVDHDLGPEDYPS